MLETKKKKKGWRMRPKKDKMERTEKDCVLARQEKTKNEKRTDEKGRHES